MLSHIGHTILGMNSVQLYMKIPGCRTPGIHPYIQYESRLKVSVTKSCYVFTAYIFVSERQESNITVLSSVKHCNKRVCL